MAKQFKINIKNTQLAEAINLSEVKKKLASKKLASASSEEAKEEAVQPSPPKEKVALGQEESSEGVETPKIKARTRSAFAEPKGATKSTPSKNEEKEILSLEKEETPLRVQPEESTKEERLPFSEEVKEPSPIKAPPAKETHARPPEKGFFSTPQKPAPRFGEKSYSGERTGFGFRDKKPFQDRREPPQFGRREPSPQEPQKKQFERGPVREFVSPFSIQKKASPEGLAKLQASQKERLGPTGKHISDFVKPPPPPPPRRPVSSLSSTQTDRPRPPRKVESTTSTTAEAPKKHAKPPKTKDFKDFKPLKKAVGPSFDSRDRQGLRQTEGEEGSSDWRKRRGKGNKVAPRDEASTVRPTSLKVRLPISIKDLASELKLKASELISKLFMQGMIVTLNDFLDDETVVQLIGNDFACEITIDTAEEERIRITDKSIKEETLASSPDELRIRPPIVTFMGHVDHGKTSLIDAIRKSNRAGQEAGAITQHIGAFKCFTPVGEITILDTPGHEAFSAMRARGADVTDIVVLVVAGDEGMKQQTLEALQHAKSAGVTIVVAINKCDKPNFNAETVYRQLAQNDLLPEAWGGQTITINCSAVTHEGIQELLEMLALQAEVLELKANPEARARGTVIESELHEGLGIVATILVQNGTLKRGDAIVFGAEMGRVKTMRDEFSRDLQEAPPSTPVSITGLSGLPEAGQEFIVVKDEKEARQIAEKRFLEKRQRRDLLVKRSLDSILLEGQEGAKKVLRIVLRADVQGSLEALKTALLKIESSKVDLDILFTGIGSISESDVQLAAASKAIILGFHNSIEPHAEKLAKELSVVVKMHDIIYHALDDVKTLMAGQLEKLAQENTRGSATVLQTFKSSQVGIIAGCMVNDGSVHRNFKVVVKRKGQQVWRGSLSSLKRLKDDVKEVQKGFECGIVLDGFNDIQPDDQLEFFETTYITQEL